jgi:ABC-type glycerol-3-phosphate transport system substrate-binding protein
MLLGALALVLLVACGPTAPGLLSGAAALQPLVLWHALPPDATETLLQQVERFNAENPWGISLAVERMSTPSALRAQLSAAVTRRRMPDLALIDPADVAELLNTGGLVDLRAYADAPSDGLDQTDREDLLPLFFGDEPGAWTSAPAYLHLFILYYNAEWLARLGADAPPTWDEFKRLCLDAVAGANGSDRFGYVYVEDGALTLSWLWSRGGDALSADGRHATFNGQAGLEALTLLNELVFSGCATTGDAATTREDFAHGRALFTFASSAEIDDYYEAVEAAGIFHHWSITAPPRTAEQPVVVASGPRWTIWRTTPERQQAAWRVLRWFSSPATTAGWAYNLHAFPLRASAARALSATLSDDLPTLAGFDLLAVARAEPTVPGWGEVRRLLSQAATEVTRGVPPERALSEAAERADRALSSR